MLLSPGVVDEILESLKLGLQVLVELFDELVIALQDRDGFLKFGFGHVLLDS